MVYSECIFLGVAICGAIAAKRKPRFDKDYIIILGCGIARDGSLLPLVRGRVDRAISFAEQQLGETGRRVVFVPSGGKGGDETIAEGEAMRRYLLKEGYGDEAILAETESSNTLQNMMFSKNLIEGHVGKDTPVNVAFSTTNYHVFRSGILARRAGLDVEGMGARTKWYFWPNAFAREFAGLMVSEWKTHIIVLLVMIIFLAVPPVVL